MARDYSPIVQLVEYRTANPYVPSSSPTQGATLPEVCDMLVMGISAVLIFAALFAWIIIHEQFR